jgi:hypothetical protein
MPALLGMLVLVFFPFSTASLLSFTNANIYNTDQSITELWIGFDNFVDILTDVSVSSARPRAADLRLHNFYWTLWFTVVWTISNVTIGVTGGLILALVLNTPGLRAAAVLPGAPDPALGGAELHHRADLEGHVPQAVRRDQPDPADRRRRPVSWFDEPLTSFLAVLDDQRLAVLPVHDGGLPRRAAVDPGGRLRGGARRRRVSAGSSFGITLPSLQAGAGAGGHPLGRSGPSTCSTSSTWSPRRAGGRHEILITEAYKLAFEQYRYGYAAAYSTIIFVILLAYGDVAEPHHPSHGGDRHEPPGDQMPHAPLHLFLILVAITLYPVLWVVTIAFSGGRARRSPTCRTTPAWLDRLRAIVPWPARHLARQLPVCVRRPALRPLAAQQRHHRRGDHRARGHPGLHRGLRLLPLPLPRPAGGADVVPRLADVPGR